MVNLCIKLEIIFRNFKFRLRGCILSMYLKLHGCKVGKRLNCKQWPLFRRIPTSNLIIGDEVNIGYRISFDFNGDGVIILGNHVDLTQDILISASKKVKIGSFSLIAEFVSIRDSDHGIKKDQLIYKQSGRISEITIGQDVWISAGVRILKGSHIPDGVVIGANSIVNSSSILEEKSIYAGNPVRFIKPRP